MYILKNGSLSHEQLYSCDNASVNGQMENTSPLNVYLFCPEVKHFTSVDI
jgi:hypothetical protein